MELDLTLIADNGQQIWADSGIRHYVDDIYLEPAGYVDYTFFIQNPDIPEYHKRLRRRSQSRTHWERSVG